MTLLYVKFINICTVTDSQVAPEIFTKKVKVKLSLCLNRHHAMKAIRECTYGSTHSLTSPLDGGVEMSGELHAPATLPQGKSPW
jgi:hypothetical protein